MSLEASISFAALVIVLGLVGVCSEIKKIAKIIEVKILYRKIKGDHVAKIAAEMNALLNTTNNSTVEYRLSVSEWRRRLLALLDI